MRLAELQEGVRGKGSQGKTNRFTGMKTVLALILASLSLQCYVCPCPPPPGVDSHRSVIPSRRRPAPVPGRIRALSAMTGWFLWHGHVGYYSKVWLTISVKYLPNNCLLRVITFNYFKVFDGHTKGTFSYLKSTTGSHVPGWGSNFIRLFFCSASRSVVCVRVLYRLYID